MSGKMFLTKTPALPSKCAVCYTDAKGIKDFIDFGSSLDYYGAILICSDCIVNAAELVDMVPVARDLERENRIQKMSERYVIALEKVAALEHIVRAYDIGSDSGSASGTDPSVDVQIDFSESDESDGESSSSDELANAGKGDFPRPVK